MCHTRALVKAAKVALAFIEFEEVFLRTKTEASEAETRFAVSRHADVWIDLPTSTT